MRTGTGAGSDAIMLHSTLHTKKRNSLKLVKKGGRQIRLKAKGGIRFIKLKSSYICLKKVHKPLNLFDNTVAYLEKIEKIKKGLYSLSHIKKSNKNITDGGSTYGELKQVSKLS